MNNVHLSEANSQSGGNRRVKQPATVLPPRVLIKQCRSRWLCAGTLRWCGADKCAVNTLFIVISPEVAQLPFQIDRIPKEPPIIETAAGTPGEAATSITELLAAQDSLRSTVLGKAR